VSILPPLSVTGFKTLARIVTSPGCRRTLAASSIMCRALIMLTSGCCTNLPQINAAVGCLARLPLPSPDGGGLVHRRHRGFATAPTPLPGPPPSPGWRGRGAATASRLREAWNPYLRHALISLPVNFSCRGARPPKQSPVALRLIACL